jgi:uncharacterized protein (UPF0548 family)
MSASVADLARLTFAYDELAGTRGPGPLPPGYHHLHRTEVLGEGPAAFEAAVEGLMTWRMHRGAGLDVDASAPRAAPDVDVLLRFGAGPLSVSEACRVVYLCDEPSRRGFAYGTLNGSPSAGEAAFAVTAAPSGEVALQITAFSRPRGILRLGRPLLPVVLGVTVKRYVDALRQAVAAG